jgi:hypothetical protein
MSQLGGPGADIPEMSLSKYPWPGLLVKGILIRVQVRRSQLSVCGFELVYAESSHLYHRLQLQQWYPAAKPGGPHGSASDTVGPPGTRPK